ncbi:MAG: SOS response-associated peptidase [Thiogranum sp.]
MCGRYVSKIDADVERHFSLTKVPFEFSSYNVAPGTNVPVVRGAETGERELVLMRWGLIPHWAKEERIGYKMINARAETVASKPAFRQPFKRHRCLIPANGFYEWPKTQSGKVPYFIHPRDQSVMGFAGLWDIWVNPAGERIGSCTIITTAANEVIQPLHDRMPLIITPDDYGVWLTGNVDGVSEVMRIFPSVQLEAYPVSTRVNKPENDDPSCIVRVA